MNAAEIKVFLHLHGGAGQLCCRFAEITKITMRNPAQKRRQTLRNDIIQIVVIHGMQRIDKRFVELFGKTRAGKANAKFLMDMDDVRLKIAQHTITAVAERRSKAKVVQLFHFLGRTVQNAVLYVMVPRLDVNGYNQNLMSQMLKPVVQRLDMRYNAVDIRQVSLCK